MKAQFLILLSLCMIQLPAQTPVKGRLLHTDSFSTAQDTAGWRMEGPGQVDLANGWLKMYSPGQKGHHVYWCPQLFPGNFIAEWEVQNLHLQAGLCIVFFSASGLNNEDIFDPALPVRDGTFKQYTNGALNNYHISYYANTPNEPQRETAHLRKNKGFHLVHTGESGIPVQSADVHRLQLVKQGGHIQLFINGRKVIDWLDDGKKTGPVLPGGRIGFRQMKWTQFAYRNFSVWENLTPANQEN